MELNYIIGNDNGNSQQKIIINGQTIRQPNVYTKISIMPNLEELSPDYVAKNIEDNLLVTIDSKSLNNGAAATYMVGNNAIKSGKNLRNIEVGAVNSKLNSEVPIINTLAMIAGTAAREIFKSGKKEVRVNIDMTTGLPVNQYSKENAKLFSNRFIGEHKVTVFLGLEKISVLLNFTYVKVLPEATPTTFYLRKNKITGYEKFDFVSKDRILHVSIGEGTTEFPLTVGQGFNPSFISGTNNGVGHATNNVLLPFMTMKSLAKYTRQDFSEVIKNPSHRYYDDAIELMSAELENQAFIISDFAKQEIAKANNEIDYVLIYGGGSILMKPYLKNAFETYLKQTGIELVYIPEELCIDIEALGMYEFCQSDIFKALKQRYREREK